MKKLGLVLVAVIGSISLFSCTPEDIAEDLNDGNSIEERAGRDRDVWADDEF